MPSTIPKLRDLMLHHGIIGRMQIHEQWPDLTNKQFNFQELSAILYFIYTNKLNPEFYRGRMLPYGVTQQLSQLVLHQTYYYMFLAVHHVHSTSTFRYVHFIVWAKINIARFQRRAISSIASPRPHPQCLPHRHGKRCASPICVDSQMMRCTH